MLAAAAPAVDRSVEHMRIDSSGAGLRFRQEVLSEPGPSVSPWSTWAKSLICGNMNSKYNLIMGGLIAGSRLHQANEAEVVCLQYEVSL